MNNNILLCRAASIIFLHFHVHHVSISKLHINYIINVLWYFFYNCIGQQLTTKKKFCCLHATSEAELFFSFNFTIFFGLVLKADWIFLFRAQMIRILLWTLKCYDIKITKKKKKRKKENTKWKKKIKTRILTRQTFEYFTQRNESCMYHSDPLAKKWKCTCLLLEIKFH